METPFEGRRPPCPDPDNFIWVTTKKGGFWRRKRGVVKKAKLNEQYRLGSEHMKISGPAARRIVQKLKPYLTGLVTGRLTARVSGKLRTGLNATGKLDFAFLKGFDLQEEHPMTRLLLAQFDVVQKNDVLVVKIPVDRSSIKQNSKLVTNYFFELVLLWGDAGVEYGLKSDSEVSELFGIKQELKKGCVLQMPLPKGQWMALLKVSCMEGQQLPAVGRNYGMKVIAAK